jgi:hypothetical protein
MLVSIYGTALGPAEGCVGRADPTRVEQPSPLRPHPAFSEMPAYPTELCGVRVEVGGQPAGLLYAQERQINFKVPQSAPVEGTAEIKVIHAGRSSQPVEIKFGLEIISVKLAEPARIGMPVWIDVSMPFGWESSIQYPFALDPADTGCHQVEVRRQGKLLPRLASAGERRLWSGVGSGPMCGFLGLPDESKHGGWIPLHTLYRFDQAGT